MSRRRPRVPGTFEAHAARAAVDPDEFDDDAKNGLAIRNACATEGPYRVCGAAVELVVNRAYPALMHLVFEHEDDCPVTRDPYDWREVFTPDEDPPAP